MVVLGAKRVIPSAKRVIAEPKRLITGEKQVIPAASRPAPEPECGKMPALRSAVPGCNVRTSVGRMLTQWAGWPPRQRGRCLHKKRADGGWNSSAGKLKWLQVSTFRFPVSALRSFPDNCIELPRRISATCRSTMSRLKKFTRSLFAGYVQMGANIFYTLASVPLALHYLGKAEFGLWALTSQLGGYILLIDLGMSGSVSRILIDHKDDRSNGAYGGVIKTGALVGAVQAVLIMLAGTGISLLAGTLLHVPEKLREDFVWLMIGQSVLMGLSFGTRIFGSLLIAHQRLDISSYGAAVSFFLYLAAMWAGFAGGLGVFSLLIGLAAMTLGSVGVSVWGCLWLGLFPRAGEWGRASRGRFRELFVFAQGMFLINLGSQLISASQTILLTRLLGLEAAATWAVCTRAYNMVIMVVWRIADYAGPALSEMIVRGERAKLLARFQDMTVLMAGLGLLCGSIFAAANGSFVQVWTAGKIHWPAVNDVLLGLCFLTGTLQRINSYLIGATKELGFLRFIYLVEGLAFVGLNLLASGYESMTLMLILSLFCTLLFTFPYSLWRIKKYFELGWREMLSWLKPTWQLIWRFIPVVILLGYFTRKLPTTWQLVLNICVTGIWGAVVLLQFGLGNSLQTELWSKLPHWLQKQNNRSQRMS